MAVEAKRGCGYRKVGGIYLVGEGEGIPCCKLPIRLHICPTCAQGVKQTRGWTWIDPRPWLAGDCSSIYRSICPAAQPDKLGEKVGLLWIGTAFYKTPEDFMQEAAQQGISRRIIAVPRGFKASEHYVFFAHPKVFKVVNDNDEWQPGIFRIFKPTRIEKIVTETMARDQDAMDKLAKQGITPVIVPDNDRDHQGSVGIEILCAQPRSVTPQLGNTGIKLLPGSIIDVMPTAASVDPPELGPVIRSTQTLRAWQMAECQKLRALGWTKNRIADHLGLCTGTISEWARSVPNVKWMRKTSNAEKAEIKKRVLQYIDAHPEESTTEIAAKFAIKPYLVARYAKQVGKPMPHRPGAHKLGKYQAQILEMFEHGKSYEQIGKAIGHPSSSVGYFIKRLGLAGKSKTLTSGMRIENYKSRIIELIAAGKSDWAISRELDEVSYSGIAGFIERNGLRKHAASK